MAIARMRMLVLCLASGLLAACGWMPVPFAAAIGAGSRPTTPPPWPAPADPIPGLDAIGIRAYLQTTYDVHVHAHLDVYYDGQPVTVPGGLGIDPKGHYIAPLHTHTPTGVLHLEGPTGTHFTLGQVFTVWGVPLGGAIAYQNGNRVADPASLVLAAHDEVAVVFGTSPERIPVAYGGWGCIDLSLCE